MTKRNLDRRSFLRGTGGIMIGLPALELLRGREAAAQTANRPQRFLVFMHPQGSVMSHWRPTGSERSFTFPEILSPLDHLKSRLVVIDGVKNEQAFRIAGDGHQRATISLFTCGGYVGSPSRVANRASIDQVLASRIGNGTPFRSLNLAIGAENGRNTVNSGLFHRGNNDPVTSSADPRAVFTRLVTDGSAGSSQEVARIRARRASVLDAVKENFATLRTRLGSADRQRLEAHLEKVREVESRVLGPAVTCAPPTLNLPSSYDYVVQDNHSAPAMIDLMVMAFACGQTNVGTLHFDRMQDPEFPWIRVNGGPVVNRARYDNWHFMVHDGRREPGLVAGFKWYASQFGLLLDRLAATPDAGGGSLLDSTMVLWMSDFGDGIGHMTNDLPIVMAGHAGPRGTGRFLTDRRDRLQTSQLFVSVLQAFGGNDTTFGASGLATGPLPNLL